MKTRRQAGLLKRSRPGNWSRRDFLAHAVPLGTGAIAACRADAAGRSMAEASAWRPAWQIGCYTRPWGDQDYRVALDVIAEAGFRYAGLMTAKSETGFVITSRTKADEALRIGEEAKERDLSLLSVYGGEIPVAASLEAGIAGLKRLVDNCAACRAGNLLMGGTGDPNLYDAYYRVIAECCDYAAEQGVEISIKPHGGLNATGPQCRDVVEKVGHKNFRVWYDPGNILYYSDGRRDPVADAETVAGLVTGMCVKDYLDPKNVLVTPGTGRVKFADVFDQLNRGGFDQGPLVIECLAPGNAEQTLAAAKTARSFLEQLVSQPGRPER